MKDKHLFSVLRRFSAFIGIFAVSVGAMAEDGVLLKLKDGGEVCFVFSSKPCIVPGEELLITTTDGSSVSYDYSVVRSVSFSNATSTVIEDVIASPACDVVFRLLGDKVVVEGLPAGESVSVYTLGGQLLISRKQPEGLSSLTLPLESRGVFVVRTSTGVSYKVMKK